jgi:hypothetical protein
LKHAVSKNNPVTIEQLQQDFSAAALSARGETLAAVASSYQRRLQTVLDTEGT